MSSYTNVYEISDRPELPVDPSTGTGTQGAWTYGKIALSSYTNVYEISDGPELPVEG